MELSGLIKEVKSLPIEQIIGSRITLRKKGSYYYGICPFHADTSEGSFVVTPRKGIWRCFTCGDGAGDAIDFVRQYENKPLNEAVAEIAREYSIISDQEFEQLVGKTGVKKKYVKKTVIKAPPKETEKIDTPEVLNKVFRCFAKACGLTTEDREYLLKERKINPNFLPMFFSMPSDFKKVDSVMAALKKELKDLAILEHIPGFFYSDKAESWSFYFTEGIGLAISDLNGNIVGLQIRRKVIKAKQQRYIWFSSVFADGEKGKSKGTGSGSPVDVVYPLKSENGKIAITEGKFKALVLADLGYIAISTQGTSSWKHAAKVASEINKSLDNSKTYSICFDGDFVENPAVRKHIFNLGEVLEKEQKTEIMLWDEEYGKGFDDLYHATGLNNLMIKGFGEFKSLVSSVAEKDIEQLVKISMYDTEEFKGTPLEKWQSAAIKTKLFGIEW